MNSLRIPKLCRHKATGQGVVRLNSRDFYCGVHGSPACEAEYRRLIAEWIAGGQALVSRVRQTIHVAGPADLTVNELVLEFLRWADAYYRKPSGEPTLEPECLRLALRPLIRLFGPSPAAAFGPLSLRAVREAMIEADLARAEINRRISKVRRVFKWGAGRELIPESVHSALCKVEELRRGRSQAREREPVGPVQEASVEAILPSLSRQIKAMIQLQLLSGARPGEICLMRGCDLDTSGPVWVYSPPDHKTAWRGKGRRIFLGPKAQAIVRTWLRPEREAYLFSPAEAEAERRAEQRTRRRTKVQPSQKDRRRHSPKKRPGCRYTTASYRGAIAHGIARANRERAERGEPAIPAWTPHQLRHLAASKLQREFGWDTARAILGHESPDTTAIYVERDERVACEAALRVG